MGLGSSVFTRKHLPLLHRADAVSGNTRITTLLMAGDVTDAGLLEWIANQPYLHCYNRIVVNPCNARAVRYHKTVPSRN